MNIIPIVRNDFIFSRPLSIVERCRRCCGLSPAEVGTIAAKAKNGGKYLRLNGGDISGYPSWDKAARALAQILAFYVPDADILFRILELSPLMRAQKKAWAAIGHEISAEAIRRQGKRRYRKPEPLRDHVLNTLAGRRARKAKPKTEYTLREIYRSCDRKAEEVRPVLEDLINEGLVEARYKSAKYQADPVMVYQLNAPKKDVF